VLWVNISIAVRTTIIGLRFFTADVQHNAFAAATGKSCLQCFVDFAVLFTQNWVSTQISQKLCGALTPKPLWVAPSGRVYPPWTPPHGPLPVSQKIRHWWLKMYFQIKVRKRFIGDILHIAILDFSDNILTECKNLVSRFGQEKLWSACTGMHHSIC